MGNLPCMRRHVIRAMTILRSSLNYVLQALMQSSSIKFIIALFVSFQLLFNCRLLKTKNSHQELRQKGTHCSCATKRCKTSIAIYFNSRFCSNEQDWNANDKNIAEGFGRTWRTCFWKKLKLHSVLLKNGSDSRMCIDAGISRSRCNSRVKLKCWLWITGAVFAEQERAVWSRVIMRLQCTISYDHLYIQQSV